MQILKNPEFKEGVPDNWQELTTGTTQRFTYPESGRTDGYSVAIEYQTAEDGKIAMWVQSIQIDHIKKYKLSGWIKTQNIIGDGASIKVDWKDADYNYLSTSTIMSRQKGTIPWTYFEGEVIPNPSSIAATIILDIKDCSGKVWFDDISFSDISLQPVSSHPNVYLNRNEINTIKTRKDTEPWKTAYNQMILEAETELNTPIQTVVNNGPIPPSGNQHDYYTTVDRIHREDYIAAITVERAVRSLGLAYAFTENSKYADKAIQLIKAWCIDSTTKMTPKYQFWSVNSNGYDQSWIELSVTIPGMFYGVDLIWNYSGFSSGYKTALKHWAKDFITSAKTWTWSNNFENWRLVTISSGAVIAEDSSSLQYAFDRWKTIIHDQMNVDGSLKYEITRTTSLDYSTYAANAMIQTAEIARHHGVDLYSYKLADGRGLEKTLDFHAPYVVNPLNWPYPQNNAYKGDNAALYELAYTKYKKQSYKNVILKWGRPMHETRTMGPVTLTHGSA